MEIGEDLSELWLTEVLMIVETSETRRVVFTLHGTRRVVFTKNGSRRVFDRDVYFDRDV